jgi:hypothetical protein
VAAIKNKKVRVIHFVFKSSIRRFYDPGNWVFAALERALWVRLAK